VKVTDEYWLMSYVIQWLPERLYEKLQGKVPLAVFREVVDEFVNEAREANAGDAFRSQVEKMSRKSRK
jgi:hypothetical protein